MDSQLRANYYFRLLLNVPSFPQLVRGGPTNRVKELKETS